LGEEARLQIAPFQQNLPPRAFVRDKPSYSDMSISGDLGLPLLLRTERFGSDVDSRLSGDSSPDGLLI
jgi:hypothetical protein